MTVRRSLNVSIAFKLKNISRERSARKQAYREIKGYRHPSSTPNLAEGEFNPREKHDAACCHHCKLVESDLGMMEVSCSVSTSTRKVPWHTNCTDRVRCYTDARTIHEREMVAAVWSLLGDHSATRHWHWHWQVGRCIVGGVFWVRMDRVGTWERNVVKRWGKLQVTWIK